MTSLKLALGAFVLIAHAMPYISEGVAHADDVASQIEAALEQAGENREQLELAIQRIPETERESLEFLLINMPERDLKTLSAEFLLENCEYSHRVLTDVPWGKSIPHDVFLNNVLPYANTSEKRDNWRKDFYERFLPLVKECETPSEAAALLNQKLFPMLEVKYSTKRRRADQGPFETMESGLASCTGLSVLLVDACRAVGVPARIVGTPLWSDRSGNHTWVEIWDDGWQFTGACEPTGNELNKGWFLDRASKAERDHRLHAIYAVSFQKNGQPFPMVWAPNVKDVYAVNVTDRYTSQPTKIPEGHGITRFRVIGADGKRVVGSVVVKNTKGEQLFEGSTKDERFDTNDHLMTSFPLGEKVVVSTTIDGMPISKELTVSEPEQLVTLRVNE